jgi:hypothetical protein
MKVITNLNEISTYYASGDLLDELKSKLKDGETVINVAYTDYGGAFFDKVLIAFFAEKHPDSIVFEDTSYSGQNAFIFGPIADEFLEASENYPLGFDGLEDYYYTMQDAEEWKGFEYFLSSLDADKYQVSEDALNQMAEHFSGRYSVLTSGLDYSESDLLAKCLEKEIITEITN